MQNEESYSSAIAFSLQPMSQEQNFAETVVPNYSPYSSLHASAGENSPYSSLHASAGDNAPPLPAWDDDLRFSAAGDSADHPIDLTDN